MPTSAQLEREAEQTRSQLAQTLAELRERITPGQLVDQVVDYAKDSGGGDFVRNLGRQMADNPLPVGLIGAGMAWLMLTNSSRSAGRRDGSYDTSDWASQVRDRLGDANDEAKAKMAQAASDAKRAMNQAASSVSEGAASTYGAAKSSASDAYDRLASAAGNAQATMTDSAPDLRRKTVDKTNEFLRFCTEQPLFFAGLGLAFGAVMGTLIPSTETEDHLLGETSDRLKDQARDVVQNQYQKAKATVESGLEDTAAETAAPKPAQIVDAGNETSLVPTEGYNKVEEWTE